MATIVFRARKTGTADPHCLGPRRTHIFRRLSHALFGFASSAVAAIVGFGSTLALIVAAANVLGATQAETASWVTAVCLAIAGSSAWLSVRYKMPIIAAWSTPVSL